MRKCHFCREGIDDAVRVCPHCDRDLIHRSHTDADANVSGLARFIRQRRTTFQCSALFLVLVGVYGIYLHGVVTTMATGQTEFTLDELMWPLAKYCLISGAPFAALALLDPAWRSEHAAPVALVAWVVVFEYTSRKYGSTCPKTFALFFVPLVFSALAAHTIVKASTKGLD